MKLRIGRAGNREAVDRKLSGRRRGCREKSEVVERPRVCGQEDVERTQ